MEAFKWATEDLGVFQTSSSKFAQTEWDLVKIEAIASWWCEEEFDNALVSLILLIQLSSG